jgi:hypothetical protein
VDIAFDRHTVFTSDVYFFILFFERGFVRAQCLDHSRKELVGVFKFVLLHLHLFVGCGNLLAMAFDQRARFFTSFHVRRDARVGREDAAP